jgi:hypothetical protein
MTPANFKDCQQHQQRKIMRMVGERAKPADLDEPAQLLPIIEGVIQEIWPGATIEDDDTHALVTDVHAHIYRSGGSE